MRRHSVNEVPEPKKKVIGSMSYGNKLTEPHMISSTLEEADDKSLKNRRDMFEWIRSSTYPPKVKLSCIGYKNKDFQENSDDEVDERTNEKYLRDLDIEFHERALLARLFSKMSEPFYKSSVSNSSLVSSGFQPKFTPKLIQSSQQVHSSQNEPKCQKDYKTKYQNLKAKLALLEAGPSTNQSPKPFQSKNKGLVLMALADDELVVGKNHSRNGEWIDIIMRKRHIRKPIWYLDSGCSISMTGVKSYLHKYEEQPSLKVVFGNNSSCITEGYGSRNCVGIVFSKVAFINGLKYNLIGISQLCDAKYIVQFDDKQRTIFNANKEIVLISPRRNNVYVLGMSSLTPNGACFFVKASESVNWLWHKRISHLNFKNINKLAKQNLVLGLPSICLHLLHMDLFGPVSPISINHEKDTLVIVDEYSRYTWVHVLEMKSQATEIIMSFIRMIVNQNDVKVKQIITNNGIEFKNSELKSFYDEKRISQNFSFPYTPEQNGMAKRKNRTLIEAARTMLNGLVLSKHFWTRAFRIACYTQNRSIIIKRHDKTPYEIFRERIPDISYIHDTPLSLKLSESLTLEDNRLGKLIMLSLMRVWKPSGMLTRSMVSKLIAALTSECLFVDFLSEIEPKKVSKALKHPGWVDAIYQSNPKEFHLIVIERIFRYLKGTPTLGIWCMSIAWRQVSVLEWKETVAVEDEETKLMKETPYELLKDEQKKQLGKNNEAKMNLYNTLPRNSQVENGRINQGNSQVKNCKIVLLTQEYEKFSISNEETIDSGFT
ncbi:retrovirus-related pol polyprotein from transposon TNT 1-94 [Tanacetum coccineum]